MRALETTGFATGAKVPHARHWERLTRAGRSRELIVTAERPLPSVPVRESGSAEHEEL
jgi:hypothetical protein